MDGENKAQFLNYFIQTIIFLVPFCAVIWKLSVTAYQVSENKKNISGIGNKLNSVVADLQAENNSLSEKITALGKDVTELLTSVRFIKDSLTALQRDVNNKS